MNETKFTPGPWTTQGWGALWAYIPVNDARHNLVCSMYPDPAHDYSRNEVLANAHLIAAAPDLYEALAGIIADDDSSTSLALQRSRWDDRMVAARAALAKARGEQP